MDIWNDITMQLIMRIRRHDNEISIILKGHLLSEYLINLIIKEKIKGAKINDFVPYSKKLKLIEASGLLPKEILRNLRLLNSFRNKLTHNLDVTIDEKEMLFFKENESIICIKPKKGCRYPLRDYLKVFCGGSICQLRNHMIMQLKIDPTWQQT